MKQGRTISKTEHITKRAVGKALLGVIGIGLASGVALIAGTNVIMSRLFPEKKYQGEEEN